MMTRINASQNTNNIENKDACDAQSHPDDAAWDAALSSEEGRRMLDILAQDAEEDLAKGDYEED